MQISMPDKAHRSFFRPLVSNEAWERLEEPGVFLMGAVEDHSPAAALVVQLEEQTAELLWIGAAPLYQGRGYAAALLRALVRALEKTAPRTELFAFFPDIPEQESLLRLLLGCDFRLEYPFAADIYGITVGSLTESELARRKGIGRGALPLGEVPEVYLRTFGNSRRGQVLPVDFPLRREDYLPASAAFVRDGALRGLLLLEAEGRDLSLAWCYAAPGESAAVPAMLYRAAAALRGHYPPATRFWLKTADEASRVIARAIGGQTRGTAVLLARRTLEMKGE